MAQLTLWYPAIFYNNGSILRLEEDMQLKIFVAYQTYRMLFFWSYVQLAPIRGRCWRGPNAAKHEGKKGTGEKLIGSLCHFSPKYTDCSQLIMNIRVLS